MDPDTRQPKESNESPGIVELLAGPDQEAATAAANRIKGMAPTKAAELAAKRKEQR